MSYILYSSIARAGGIDLYLGLDSISHPPLHPVRRRPKPARTPHLRRLIGRGLIALGRGLSVWGDKWAPTAASPAALPGLKAAT